MRYLILIIFFLSSIVEGYSQCEIHGRRLQLSFYPEKAEGRLQIDWKSIKLHFEKAKSYDDMHAVDHDLQTSLQIWYSFGRIADMNWSDTQKEEIITYLINFSKIVEQQLLKPYEDNLSSLSSGISSYPIACLWTILQLDFVEGCGQVERHIGKISNIQLIRLLQEYYKQENFSIHFTNTVNKIKLTSSEKKIVDETLVLNSLPRMNSQKEAWNALLDIYSTQRSLNNLDSLEINAAVWIGYNLIMEDVHETVHADELIDLILKKEVMVEEYLLLYSLAGVLLGQFRNNGEFDKNNLNQYFDLKNQFYEEYESIILKASFRVDPLNEATKFITDYQKNK